MVPTEFERASSDFLGFSVAARDFAALASTHQAYTMTQGVLQTFRRRLSFEEAMAFANVLPLLLRALFVTDWAQRSRERRSEIGRRWNARCGASGRTTTCPLRTRSSAWREPFGRA